MHKGPEAHHPTQEECHTCGQIHNEALASYYKEVMRLRDLIRSLGGDPDK